ncbi:GAF domain-containing protein [Leptolyngbya sp. FACHB-17]|uniref:GAF domain-containing protein n=1 Tax=unclassified Leptolyngbya TaxID=2650499 RepID=UPI001F54F21D|nr:GAF domain-containing protein [Leptolyngbya sp. FACHB-17]
MSASHRSEPTLDLSSMFSAEPTLEEFTAFLSETPVEVNGMSGRNAAIEPAPMPESVATYTNGNGASQTNSEETGRDFQQVVTALTGLKSELKRTGLLEKPNIQNLFRQVAEFAAVQPKQQGGVRELRNHRKQLTTIAAQMRLITDMDALMKVFVKVARETLQADRALIYRFNTQDTGSIIAESVVRGWTPALGATPSLTCFCFDQPEDYVMHQVVVVEDVNRVDLMPYQHQLLEQLQVKASLSLPIRVSGQAWGLLILQQCSRSRVWQEVEINLLHQLCLELTINLQQSEFSSKLTQQNEAEKAVFKVIDRIRRSLDLDTVFRTTTQEIRQLLKVDRVSIYRFEPDWSGEFVAESTAPGWTSLLQEQIDSPILKQNISECSAKQLGNSSARTTDTYLQQTQGGKLSNPTAFRAVSDIYEAGFSPCYIEMLERYQARAYVIVPILQNQKLWGLLAAYQNSASRDWQDAEISLMSRLGLQLGVAIQQAQNLQQLRSQTDQLAKVSERERAAARVIDKIRTSLDLNTIFKTATQEVRQFLNTDRVCVYRFSPDWSGEFVAESVVPGWISLMEEQLENAVFKENASDCDIKTIGRAKSIDTYLQQTQGGAYAKGTNFRAVSDIYKAGFSPCYLGVLERYQAKAYIIVPIMQGEKLWGLLAAYQNSGVRHWDDSEVSLMIQIGTQLGVAIQQAEYLKQVEAQTEQLKKAAARERNFIRVIDQVNKSVLERIRQSSDIETIFGQTTQQIRQFLQTDRIAIYRFNEDWGGVFVSESITPGWSRLVGADFQTTWDDTHLQETQGGRYRNNESIAVDDIYKAGHLPCHTEKLEQFQVKAYMIVPIFAGQKLWGLMGAYQNNAPRHWEESEINLLAQLGAQLGVAIQQSEYLSQIQRQAEREKILSKISDRIRQPIDLEHQSSDVNSIFQAITQDIRQFIKVDRAALYRFNPDWSGDFVYESVSAGWSKLVGSEIGTNVQDTHLRDTKGGRYRNRESLAIDDIYNAGHDPCHVELLEKFEARAYVLVPVFSKQELWGILAVYQNNGPRQWEDADVALLNQIAGQLGVVLEQVNSLERLRIQSEQLAEAAQREKMAKEQLQTQVIQLLTAVRPVFSGDLTVRVPVVENEVGTIADAYNNTIQSLRKIVTQVQTSATQVTNTSHSSSTAIAKLTEQAEEQLQEVTRALDQLQAMVSSTQAVAANARQVETALQQANQTVRSGDAAMNRTVDSILAIRETVAETSKKIKRLSESSQKISKVVSLISNFTTQTQLLALNASIEATRAGEYGRGFTVVADEVRSLARQSAEATREIEKLSQEIQSETSAVATAMDTGIQQVVNGTGLVNETRQQLNEIINATAQISQLVYAITEATQAQTQQSKLVTQAMTDVADLANKNSEQSNQISTSFQELLNTAQQLQVSVTQFKVS